ncbi:MAG: TonB-dependent receptor [Pseudomonas sp.]|nr:TonB-dependent receptor [Pseudomonas sp.]
MNRGNKPTRYPRLLLNRLAIATLAGIATLASAQAAEGHAPVAYQIGAGSVTSQLQQVAEQSAVTIRIDKTLLAGRQSPGLQGEYTPKQAIDTLLAGTDVQAVSDSAGTYSLQQGGLNLQAVMVSGEKLERSLKETTTAVSVLSGADVDTGELQSVYNIGNRVPNLTKNGAGLVNIRGVEGTGPASGVFTLISGARPRISTTVDGSAEAWSGQQYLDVGLWDVKQVEVLRGPQSTTQGRNAIGGAIIVETNDPSFTWEGATRAGWETEDGRGQLAGVVSGPLIENELAFRLAAEGLKGNTYTDYSAINGQTGKPWTVDPSAVEKHSIRGKLLWTPEAISDLSAKLTVAQRKHDGAYLNWAEGDPKDYEFTGATSNTRVSDTDSTVVSTDIEYGLSESLTAHLLLSHTDYQAHFTESGADNFQMDQDEKTDTLEARLAYAGLDNDVDGVVGVYYSKRDQDLLAAPNGFVGDDQTKTSAVFGESTVGLTERLDLILGARLEREEQTRDVTAWPGAAWQGLVQTDIGETMLLPKLGLSYAITPQTTLGLTAREGYNPGGGSLDWNTSEFYEYDKEEVKTYEFSSRSLLLNNRLSLNANLFFNDYTDYQALQNRRFTNVKGGETYGFEIDATAYLDDRLEVFGSLGLLHSKVTEANAENPGIEGNEFSSAPDYTAGLGFKKTLDSGFFFGGDVSYVAEYYSDLENTKGLEAGDYLLTNLNAGYEADEYSIRLYSRNLFDEETIYRTNANWGGNSYWVGAPRTLGIVADYRF